MSPFPNEYGWRIVSSLPVLHRAAKGGGEKGDIQVLLSGPNDAEIDQ
jgi:hypothetical protein